MYNCALCRQKNTFARSAEKEKTIYIYRMGDFPYIDWLTKGYKENAEKSHDWADYLKVCNILFIFLSDLLWSLEVERGRTLKPRVGLGSAANFRVGPRPGRHNLAAHNDQFTCIIFWF